MRSPDTHPLADTGGEKLSTSLGISIQRGKGTRYAIATSFAQFQKCVGGGEAEGQHGVASAYVTSQDVGCNK